MMYHSLYPSIRVLTGGGQGGGKVPELRCVCLMRRMLCATFLPVIQHYNSLALKDKNINSSRLGQFISAFRSSTRFAQKMSSRGADFYLLKIA